MNKIFEAVPVSEKPQENNWYILFDKDNISPVRTWQYLDGHWYDSEEHVRTPNTMTHWLRPIPPPTKEAEQRTKELYPDRPDSLYADIAAKAQRAAYLKGHQEASTGQAGEARTVKSMLESIEIIGELAKEMTEQKLETGTNTPLQIIHNIGMAIEVFVKEVNKSLSSTPSPDKVNQP